MRSVQQQWKWLASLALAAMTLAGCTQGTPQPPAPAAPFKTHASIREIMDAEVDPAADAIWESVVFTVTASGAEDKQPRTADEWKAVRRSAVTLVEAANLLMMDGRRMAPIDAAPVPGEPNRAFIQKRLETNHASFVGFAQAFQAVSLKVLNAIDAKDVDRLLEAGGELDEACEACHVFHWYPPEAMPSQ